MFRNSFVFFAIIVSASSRRHHGVEKWNPLTHHGLSAKRLASLSHCLHVDDIKVITKAKELELYEELNFQYNTVSHIESAGYIVPKNSFEVQIAVSCCVATKIRLVVKSGGHSYEKYSYGDPDTVVIDLRKLNRVKVDVTGLTATIGPGTLNGQLFYQLWRQGNYVAAGGMCVSVGFGGSSVGGGYGWLSKQYGLIVDNLLEMTVVTHTGTVVKASAEENDDLFWALRGGGGSFGIVTSFTSKIYSSEGLQYHFISLTYPLSDLVTMISAVQNVFVKNSIKATFTVLCVDSTGISVEMFDLNLTPTQIQEKIDLYPKPVSEEVKTFDRFVDLVVHRPYSSVIKDVEELKDYRRTSVDKMYTKVKSYYVSKVVSTDTIEEVSKVFSKIPQGVIIAFESCAGAINKVPENETAFVHRNELYAMDVKIGLDSPAVKEWLKEFEQVILLLDNGESYQNDNDATLPDYLDRFYGSNLPRLQEIKTKYDPHNVFNFPQSIPPL